MGQLRIAGGGGSVEYRASNTTGPQILQAPDASGTIALEPSGTNGAYLARNADASVAERTAAGAITFSNTVLVERHLYWNTHTVKLICLVKIYWNDSDQNTVSVKHI